MKPYLLIVGDNYYPSAYTNDWVGCYSTREEAYEEWEKRSKSKHCNDWYEIVDLREWMSRYVFTSESVTEGSH